MGGIISTNSRSSRGNISGRWDNLRATALAIDTGQPQGEEFFSGFLDRGTAGGGPPSASMRSRSVGDGAFRFNITLAKYPDGCRGLDLPRRDLEHAGFALLTSMYLFDELARI
jgi:glucan biosynthesis protein